MAKLSVRQFTVDPKKSNEQNYKNIADQLSQINAFEEIVKQHVAKLLVDNTGEFVDMIAEKLGLGGGFGLSAPAPLESMSVSSNNFTNDFVNALNDPNNSELRDALKNFMIANFGLTPNTPSE